MVRIRPQIRPDEPVADLVEDPWKTFSCPAGTAGCLVEFEDPDFAGAAREAVYYVRAIQEPTPAVNARITSYNVCYTKLLRKPPLLRLV